MKNLLSTIKERTQELNAKKSSTFNTSDFMLKVLLNKKEKRSDVINLIIEERMKLQGLTLEKLEKMKDEEIDSIVNKLYKTSKNGLDTSVSDSNNNSSFSYNQKFKDYTLVKEGSYLTIIKK